MSDFFDSESSDGVQNRQKLPLVIAVHWPASEVSSKAVSVTL